MKKLSADYILSPNGELLKDALLIIQNDGHIIDLLNPQDKNYNLNNAKHYSGILSPGFINCHCHLELSSFKNKIPPKQGLISFLKKLIGIRKTIEEEEKEEAISLADDEMYKKGIIAVGDICNTTDSFAVKQKSKIYYHNFIEVFGSEDEEAKKMQTNAEELAEICTSLGMPYNIIPHAPYSVSDSLWQYLSTKQEKINSIHHQEIENEDDLYYNRKGHLFDRIKNIKKEKNTNYSSRPIEEFSSQFSISSNLILVHNIYATQKDITHSINDKDRNYFWCFCPKANLYIEDKLPDINLFIKNPVEIVIGTDSLASNNNLSILEEIKILQSSFPLLKTADLLLWGTLNGAKALEMDNEFGSFEANKKPGVIQITNIHPAKLSFTSNSEVIRII